MHEVRVEFRLLLGRYRRCHRAERTLHRFAHLTRRLAMPPEDRLDGEAVEFEDFAALPGHRPQLLWLDRLSHELFDRDRRADHGRAGSRADRRRIRHMVDMAVAEMRPDSMSDGK